MQRHNPRLILNLRDKYKNKLDLAQGFQNSCTFYVIFVRLLYVMFAQMSHAVGKQVDFVANNKRTGQPAQLRSLIRAFALHVFENIMQKLDAHKMSTF